MTAVKDAQYPSLPTVFLVLSYRTVYAVERTPCAHPCRTQGSLRVREHTPTAGNKAYRVSAPVSNTDQCPMFHAPHFFVSAPEPVMKPPFGPIKTLFLP